MEEEEEVGHLEDRIEYSNAGVKRSTEEDDSYERERSLDGGTNSCE